MPLNLKMTVIPIVVGALGTAPKAKKKTGRIEDQRKGRNLPNYNIPKIN